MRQMLPIIRVTDAQKEYLDAKMEKSGNSYASMIRDMIQRDIDEDELRAEAIRMGI